MRRDCTPHRGNWLLLMTSVALVCGGAAFLFAVPAILGIPLGVVTVDMARRDLGRMAEGSLDPRGREQTIKAEQRALNALDLNVYGFIVCLLLGCCLCSVNLFVSWITGSLQVPG
jgi:hypothetical protein